MKLLEVLHDLNKELMLNGFQSDYTIKLNDSDFNKFVIMFEKENNHLINYPDLNPFLSLQNPPILENIKRVKIAGPGSYFLIERK